MVYDRVVNRQDIVSGKKERRLDVGFKSDGLVSADVTSWMSRVMAEFFSNVSVPVFVSDQLFDSVTSELIVSIVCPCSLASAAFQFTIGFTDS